MNASAAPGTPAVSAPRRPGRTGRRLIALAIALVVVTAGFAVYSYWRAVPPGGEPTLVVYTYDSLLGGSNCSSPLFDSVFGAFGRTHSVHVQVECPAGTLVSTLLAQKNAPGADLVIGLDEITTVQAEQDGLLVPYSSPTLADVPASLVSGLSGDRAATPYEWGYLAIDYNRSFAEATQGAVADSGLEQFAANATWARSLLVEDPTTDISCEYLLLWQIAYYQSVLHQDWTGFWRAVAPVMPVAPDWGTAFNEFSSPGGPPMVVSYLADPAYAAYYGVPGSFNATVCSHNGTHYGWKTIYGLGIVQGTRHLTLDEQFVDWFLSGSVQAMLPTSEWEFPANSTVPVPGVFNWSLPASSVVPLNAALPPESIAANLTAPHGWLETWLSIAG